MAFPTIPAVADGRIAGVNQLNTTATLTGPNLNTLTLAPGDLLIAIAGEYQSNAGADAAFTGWAGGGLTWTEIRDSTGTAVNRLGVAYARVVTGTEAGTVTVTRSGTLTGDASMIVLVIPGAHASAAPEANTMSTGTGTATPGTLAPSWGADDTLWIAVNGNGMTSGSGTWTANNGAPTNYTGYYGTAPADTSTIGDFGSAVAFRQLNAASDTVAAFSQDTSNARNSALLIAVRPVPPGLSASPADPVGVTDAQALAVTKPLADNVGATDSSGSSAASATVVGSGTTGVDDALTQSHTFAKPGGVVAGDLVIGVFVEWNSGSFPTLTLPTGATQVVQRTHTAGLNGNGNIRSTIWAKAVGAETDYTMTASTQVWGGHHGVFVRDWDTALSFVDLWVNGLVSIGNDSTVDAIGDTYGPNDLAVWIVGNDNDGSGLTHTPPTSPTGFVERVDAQGATIATKESVNQILSATGGTISTATTYIVDLLLVPGRPASSGSALTLEVGKGLSEAVGVTDVADVVLDSPGLSASPADPVGITDTAARALDAVRTQGDAVGVTDARTLAVTKPMADPAGATDVLAVSQTRSPADAVGASDALALETARTLSDPAGVTDAAAAALSAARAQDDPVGVTDALTALLSKELALPDSVGVTDVAATVLDAARTQADAVGVADTTTVQQSLARALDDVAGVTDVPVLARALELTEALTGSDATVLDRGLELADAAGLVDALDVSRETALADALGATDALSSPVERDRPLSDLVEATDALSTTVDYVVDLVDAVGVTDATQVSGAGAANLDDAVSVTDAMQADYVSGDHPVDLADSADLLDAVVLERGAHAASPVGVTDALDAAAARERAVDEVIGAADALSPQIDAHRSLAETVGVTDALDAVLGATADLMDPVGVSDALTVVQDIARTVADTAGANEGFARTQDLQRAFSDAAGLTDAASGGSDYAVPVTDALGVTDEMQAVAAVDAQLADVAVLTDSVSWVMHRAVDLEELVTAQDVVATQALVVLDLADGLDLADTLTYTLRSLGNLGAFHIVVLEPPPTHVVDLGPPAFHVVGDPPRFHVVTVEQLPWHIVDLGPAPWRFVFAAPQNLHAVDR